MAKISGTWLFNEVISRPSVIDETFNGWEKGWFVSSLFNGTSLHYDGTDLEYRSGSDDVVVYDFPTNKWTDSNYRSIDFGTTPQTVSDAFYEWFTSNAVKRYTISGKWKFNEVLTKPTKSFIDVTYFYSSADEWNTQYKIIGGFHLGVMYYTYDDGDDASFDLYVYKFESNSWLVEARIVDFGETPQTVSEEFYTWFTANATKTIDDLTGTTWYVPSGWSVSAEYGKFSVDCYVRVPAGEGYSLKGESFEENCYGLWLGYKADWQMDFDESADAIYFEWDGDLYDDVRSPAYFTIKFNGGKDTTNTSLISWFETYGELQSSTEEQPDEDEPTTPTKKFTRLRKGHIVALVGDKCFKKLSTQVYELSGLWLFNTSLTHPYDYDFYHPAYVPCMSGENAVSQIYYDSCGNNSDDKWLMYISPKGVEWIAYVFQEDTEGYKKGWHGTRYLDFGQTPVAVSKAFYNWFIANASKVD